MANLTEQDWEKIQENRTDAYIENTRLEDEIAMLESQLARMTKERDAWKECARQITDRYKKSLERNDYEITTGSDND